MALGENGGFISVLHEIETSYGLVFGCVYALDTICGCYCLVEASSQIVEYPIYEMMRLTYTVGLPLACWWCRVSVR